MTSEEWAQYCASPAGTRRRKPGDTVDAYDERARLRRTAALVREIEADPPRTVADA